MSSQTAKYKPAPLKADSDAEVDANDDDSTVDNTTQTTRTQLEPIASLFVQPTPSPWKRAALIAFTLLMFWFAFSMRMSLYEAKQQQVVHAKRYVHQRHYISLRRPGLTLVLSFSWRKIFERVQIQTCCQSGYHGALERWSCPCEGSAALGLDTAGLLIVSGACKSDLPFPSSNRFSPWILTDLFSGVLCLWSVDGVSYR